MITRRVALAAWLALVIALHGWFLWVATADPHGLGVSAAIDARNLDRVEPLYGAAWTGDSALTWSPDGKYVAVVSSSLEILDARTGRVERSWSLTGRYGEAIAWSPDGDEIAVTTSAGVSGPFRVTVYSPAGIVRGSWLAHDDYGSWGLAWSPDGTRLLSVAGGHRGEFAIWETGTWREILRGGNLTTGSSASWSPDGSRFALGAAPVVVLDASTGDVLWEDERPDHGTAAWSPRGDLIAVGTSSGRLRLHRPDGTLIADLPVPSSDAFGIRMSWSPDGALIATASWSGIHVVDVDRAAVVRLLAFPFPFEGRGTPDGPSLDIRVAWSPRGTAIAALGATSHPTFRMWAVRSSPLPLPLFLVGIVWIVGLIVVFGSDLRFALLHPREVAGLWRMTDPPFSLGTVLFGVAFGLSVMIGLGSDMVGRILGLQPIPSFSWFATMALLSASLTVLPAFAAARAFYSALGGLEIFALPPRLAPRIFAVVLPPFLFALGAVPLIAAWSLLPGSSALGLDRLLVALLLMGVALGLGATYSVRIAQGFPGGRGWRAWWAIAASVLASLAVFLGLFVLLFLALTITRFQPFGDVLRYGITVNFAFGLVPFAVILTVIVVGAIFGSATTLAHTFLPGYARSHGDQVMALESRRAVMSLIQRNPGVHFRDLLRLSRLGSGTVHYHLYVLEREGFVVGRRDGVVKRFYPVAHRQYPAAAPA